MTYTQSPAGLETAVGGTEWSEACLA